MTKGAKASRGRGGKPAAYPGFRRRLIALDVDGTIITTPATGRSGEDDWRGAVHDYQHVVIATGRLVVATMPVLARLGITQGMPCSNGAVTLIDPSRQGQEDPREGHFDPRPAPTLLRESCPRRSWRSKTWGAASSSVPFP